MWRICCDCAESYLHWDHCSHGLCVPTEKIHIPQRCAITLQLRRVSRITGAAIWVPLHLRMLILELIEKVIADGCRPLFLSRRAASCQAERFCICICICICKAPSHSRTSDCLWHGLGAGKTLCRRPTERYLFPRRYHAHNIPARERGTTGVPVNLQIHSI